MLLKNIIDRIKNTSIHDITPEYILLLNDQMVEMNNYVVVEQTSTPCISVNFYFISERDYTRVAFICNRNKHVCATYRVSQHRYYPHSKLSNVRVIFKSELFNFTNKK